MHSNFCHLILLMWSRNKISSSNSDKGQLISKCLFGVFNFFQKSNENKSTSGIIVVKSNCFPSFFGRIEDISKLTDLYDEDVTWA